MIVVSNTSPLTNLAAIGQFHLLHRLYGQIHIPDAVWNELNAHGQPWPGSSEVRASAWVVQHQAKNSGLVTALRRDLDDGESETIALALEMHADLVLLDETDGRRLAHRHGLRVMGVLGILLNAKRRRHIAAVMPHVIALRESAGFYLSDRVRQVVRDLAGE